MSFTPPRHRRPFISATPWSAPLSRDPDRHPWDVTKIDRVIADVASCGESLSKSRAGTCKSHITETMLRGSNTIHLCCERATDDQVRVLIAKKELIPTLVFLGNAADESASGARILEHVLLSFVHLLGIDKTADEQIAFEPGVTRLIATSLLDSHVVVVTCAAQLVRRLTEIPEVAHVTVFQDEVWTAVLQLLESCDDSRVLPHLLSACMNTAANEKAYFTLARCTRLVQVLVDFLFRASAEPAHAARSAKVMCNLLSFPENVPEITRIAPSLVNALIECSGATTPTAQGGSPLPPPSTGTGGNIMLHPPASPVMMTSSRSGSKRHLEGSSAAAQLAAAGGAGGAAAHELAEASRAALELLHDCDARRLNEELHLELAHGRAASARLRSPHQPTGVPGAAATASDRGGGGAASRLYY